MLVSEWIAFLTLAEGVLFPKTKRSCLDRE